MPAQLSPRPVLHVRCDGRSLDLPLDDLPLGLGSSDDEIKHIVARHLEVPESKLRDCVVDRHESGNLTVRPAAVFG
jgi:hypothetical protein